MTAVAAQPDDRRCRSWLVTDAAAHAGSRLKDLLDSSNTASDVWADTAYRSRKNEALLRGRLLVSRIHRKKPADRSMPVRTVRANGRKSKVRAHIEHVFAEQKARMGLLVDQPGMSGKEGLDLAFDRLLGLPRFRRHL